MDVITLALKNEEEGEALYRDMASKTDHSGVKRILLMLADDENRHARIITNFVEKKDFQNTEVTDTETLNFAKNMFTDMRNSQEEILKDTSMKTLYLKSIEIETKSKELYSNTAAKSTDPSEKRLMEFLAGEERKHEYLLQNMLEFIEQPDYYLENAEFSNLENIPE